MNPLITRIPSLARASSLLLGLGLVASVVSPASAQQVQVTSPNGNETWQGGEIHPIEWNIFATLPGEMRVDFSWDGGVVWTRVDELQYDGNPQTQQFSRPWTVPNLDSPLCWIRVEYDWGAGSDADTNNSLFTLQPSVATSVVVLGGVHGGPISFTHSFPARPGATTITFVSLTGTGAPWSLPGGATLDVVPDVMTFVLLAVPAVSTAVLDGQGVGATLPFALPDNPLLAGMNLWVAGAAFQIGSAFVEATPTAVFQLL